MRVWKIRFVLALPYIGRWARKKREKWYLEDDPNNKRPTFSIALSPVSYMFIWGDTPIREQLSEYDYKRFLEYNGITEADLPERLR